VQGPEEPLIDAQMRKINHLIDKVRLPFPLSCRLKQCRFFTHGAYLTLQMNVWELQEFWICVGNVVVHADSLHLYSIDHKRFRSRLACMALSSLYSLYQKPWRTLGLYDKRRTTMLN